MRWSAPRGALSVVAVALASLCAAGEAHGEPAFEGTYHFVGGGAQREGLRRAVEAVVAQMNALIRGIARSRLEPRIFAAPRMTFRSEGEELFLEHEPLPPRVVRSDGGPLFLRNRAGDDVVVSYRRASTRIVETITQGRSSQVNSYLLAQDGAGLTFATEIRAPLLPGRIHFRLSYRRR